MSSKKQLTDQQRERITQNFRAAKIIRDRKRSQTKVNPPGLVPSPASPWPRHSAADRSSLDGSCASGAEFRSPLLKKTNISLSPSTELQRKALTELNSNNVRFPSFQGTEDFRSIGKDIVDSAPRLVSSENHDAEKENQLSVPHPTSKSSLELGSTHTLPSKPDAQFVGISEGGCITGGLSQIFDEAVFHEIDALCEQRRVLNEASVQISHIPLQGDSTRLEPSTAGTSNTYCSGILLGSDVHITDNLSTCDETMLQEVDALCEQRFLAKGSVQMGNLPGDVLLAESLEGDCTVFKPPTGVTSKGLCNRPVEGLDVVDMDGFPAIDEALLHEVDALCEQRMLEKGSIEVSKGPVDVPVAESLQDGHKRLEISTAVTSKGHSNGNESGLDNSATVQTEVLAYKLPSELVSGCRNPELAICGTPHATNASEVPDFTSSVVALHRPVPPHLQKLNASQREAASSDTTKPLLILAGPGSGKTSTMVARLLTLINEGTQPANILAMTFTTAAATEMRERVAAAVGKAVSKELAISTFHSFCLQLCRAHANKLGRTSEFLVFGHGQQRKAVVEATRIALSENKAWQITGVDDDKKSALTGDDNPALWKDQARKWQQFVTQAKCAGNTSGYYEKSGNVLGAAVLKNYQKTLATCDALDYHDFIIFAVHLLKDHQEVVDECQKNWTCILVDEFQDTSTEQYRFLQLLASHNRITVVGDDDQSIFGFNGANSSGFESFRTDFPSHKEVRLHQNYRSTRCIVEAASALIRNNFKRCQTKQVFTDNSPGDKIVVRECRNETAQCALVIDCILMNNTSSSNSPAFGSTAVLYRRQVTGKLFQSAFRARKIPFNVHGVAFYRKKVIKNVTALLWTVIPGRKDVFAKRAFKALYGGEKDETKKVMEYIEKIGKSNKYGFLQAASEIFSAKVSGTFTRRQLAFGKKVLGSIKTVNLVACKEQSLSAVISAAASLLPQRPVFDKRAVVTEDGGKLLNEDEDPRTVLEFLLDDVNDFLSSHFCQSAGSNQEVGIGHGLGSGCLPMLKAFLDHLVHREEENFRCRRQEDKNSVTLTTMHQSKGLEWDTVFIVKANDTETPLLHEGQGCVSESSISLEEERRLFYVAMTRARKNLYITHIVVDSQRQILQPSRFLKELPRHLLSTEGEILQLADSVQVPAPEASNPSINLQGVVHKAEATIADPVAGINSDFGSKKVPSEHESAVSEPQTALGTNAFLKGFSIESRSVVALLFHTWAKQPYFQDPQRLVNKVGFVIDERLRTKGTKNKDVLISLKCVLRDAAALSYAQHVLEWEKLPREERTVLQAERQEHFQQQNSLKSQAAAVATPKQVSYLRSLGCTVEPSSRLHASRLIEQYRNL